MPFIHVYALPTEYLSNSDFLEKLESELIAGLAKATGLDERACHVDFAVSAPRKMRSNHMPWAYVTSGSFSGDSEEVSAMKKRSTEVVASIIKRNLGDKFTVEVFPAALDGDHKAYLKK